MASYTFTLPGTTKSFTVKGPDGFTEAQARAIFDQQASAGSFVGFKPGDVLNAASQAAAGLEAAQSQLAQGLTNIPGVGTTSLTSAAAAASTAASKTTSVAKQALVAITTTIGKTPVISGITVGDFGKQLPALTSIQKISADSLTAGLSQATKLVGQTSTQLTNAGAGQFGFNLQQLESAGVVKPGTAGQFATATSSLSDILKSPAIYTGKDGIKNVDDLLSSVPKQNAIQQDLMSKGLNAVQQLGVPTNLLSPGAAVGTALNAAKSIPSTVDWAKGLPLPSGVKTAFDQAASAGSFAADFATQKINDAMKAEIVPVPASNTINRETVNAAASRVVGNAKVPPVSYNSVPRTASADELANTVTQLTTQLDDLLDRGITIMSKTDRQRQETNSYSRDIRALELVISDLTQTSGQALGLKQTAESLDPPNTSVVAQAEQLISKVEQAIKKIRSAIDALRQNIASLTA